MKIDRLKLQEFRNLKAFEIDFDENAPTMVILGRNGCGKSNLIEALVEIFRDLEDGKTSCFSYEIKYLCHGHRIEVINCLGDKKHQQFSVDGSLVSRKDFDSLRNELLPKHIFAYYSGWNRRLESGFDEPTRKLYKQWLDNEDRRIPLRRLFYCRKEYSQLVLLAFFLSNDDSVKKALSDYLNIQCFESVLFTLRKPWWRSSGKPNKVQLTEGDPRFWYARGAFKHFLDDLWNHAIAPIYNEGTLEKDIRGRKESTERLYLFIKDLESLKALAKNHEPKTFFGLLESLFLCDLIDEVQVTVQHKSAGRIRFDMLSEGEQQLLTVLGLIIFTQQDESLFLLDEPDTHLNPAWIYNFYSLLEANFPQADSQLVIATHNPLMIGSLNKNQIRILTRTDNVIIANEPDYDPIGIGVEGLLKSELFGLRSTLAPVLIKKLDRHYELLGNQNKTESEQSEFMQLASELNELGISRTHPNPYFEAFATAMARKYSPEIQITLSTKQIEEQAELADAVLKEVLAEENASSTDINI